ncbi:type VI secretion system Vgr family protein [Luteimonas sp. RD2P54]|uniref:Type VI secretion system Vgr family protein n=1 Tax=Luteimonas endophytica TaxID=3042023 RepID=A0ABT6J672_9GAMM|nr:type VI secretion system Vgr family protein [Luteimonas endophytica]MDH5822330.1 type VI secretion system Vgr family protein [Luteimonas endophytica]
MDALATALTALLASPGQRQRLLRLHTPLGPDVLVAETLDGEESLDGGFRLELTALSVDAHLALDDLLGQPVLLELLTDGAQGRLRPFHGHVTAFERLGSNGGLARYRLVLEPWLAFLRQRVDSYVFQDKTVVEIVEDLFADYAEAGALAPAWRWELANRDIYARRSLTTQYQESDHAFLQRLLAEEGIYGWFEHDADPESDTFGSHTLVLADHGAAFADAGAVRYHRADVTERGDSIQQWTTARRWQAGRLARASWDYRSLGLRPASAEGETFGGVVAEDSDTAGPYGWHDGAEGERRARQQLEALQVDAHTVTGSGSWRRLAPGARFELTQHHGLLEPEARRFACLRVRHEARNNLGAEIHDALEQSLGAVALPGLDLPEALAGLERGAARRGDGAPGSDASHPGEAGASGDASAGGAVGSLLSRVAGAAGAGGGDSDHRDGDGHGPAEFYRNHFSAIPAAVPYRPKTVDGHGLRLHPRPTVHGTQAAIVVSDGGPVLTDRDHRIKVQFPWQRGADASSGHGHPGGDDNAPGNAGAWTWVRVATPWAGDNWGGVMVPRKGQEVLVAFLEGDIDRPVVIGSVYNGRGNPDAQHNQVAGGAAGATGNAPAWFDGNEHAAVFTGFKSQALGASQEGSGGYQQLRLDDTPGQGRAQLSTTQHGSTLTLGHLKGGEDNVRGAERGFGVELSTRASGAIRAGAGLLLTTEPGAQQLAASQAQGQLAESEQLLQALADTARSQEATLPDDPETLPAQESLKTLQETLQATSTGASASGGGQGDKAIGGGEGETPAWSAPQLVAASPDGLMSLTPADQAWVSGAQTSLLAGGDLDWASQAGTVIASTGGVALFTQGSEAPAGKPNQERGIALHAAQGKVSARAHKNEAKVAAKQSITVASTQADVEVSAPTKHVLLTATGAYLKLEGGDIELGAPGTIEFKGTKKDLTGPASASTRAETPDATLSLCEFKARGADAAGSGIVPASK